MKTAMFKTDFWTEDAIFGLNQDTKSIYLCLLTNPQRDLTPAFKLNDRMLSAYSGYSIDAIQLCRRQLIEAGFIDFVDGYYILTAQNYVQPSTGRDSKKIFERDLSRLPSSVLEVIQKKGLLTPVVSTGTSTGTTTGTSTGVINIDIDKTINIDKTKEADEVSQLYYKIVKDMQIPVRNHTHVKQKIKQLEREIGKEPAILYLRFIQEHFVTLPDDGFKPRINEALEIYTKRVKIKTWIERAQQSQQEQQSKVTYA